MMSAVGSGQLKVVELLLENGLDVGAKTAGGDIAGSKKKDKKRTATFSQSRNLWVFCFSDNIEN